MSFLNPWAIAIAAGLAVPPLVALYFLKLKRTVKPVPSTLLWKRAVEDLRVNSPFQRLRTSLLLLLQLLILLLACLALGKPMFQTVESAEETIIIAIDQSASMSVMEADGASRLDRAKEQAKLAVDNMKDGGRAMVIGFTDRATVVSSFDTDKSAIKRKIDLMEPTDSTTTLAEAMSLAEAYTQNIIIAGEEGGSDLAPESAAPDATVYLFTDGRISDSESIKLERVKVANMIVTNVGERSDNVGIIAMDARRQYERPEVLEVAATVRNFGDSAQRVDATLYVNGQPADVQELELGPARQDAGVGEADPSDIVMCVFDQLVYEGSGVVEVDLRIDDALAADNRAWALLDPPDSIDVLLVTEGNLFLDNVLRWLPVQYSVMSPAEYEAADDDKLLDGERSAFDVVMFDLHSTQKLPPGNYFFWGGVPEIDGVGTGRMIDDEVIFNWDETHPVLRHVAVEGISAFRWVDLELPPDSLSIIDGQTSSVLSYLARDGRQYLICAFGLLDEDEFGNTLMNTYWVTQVDFVVFMQNTLQYLASSLLASEGKSVRPGEPVTLPFPAGQKRVTIERPDGAVDEIPVGDFQSVHYARTRSVGLYSLKPGVEGKDRFAVNLWSETESNVRPADELVIGASAVAAGDSRLEVNEPAWQYFVMGLLAFLVIEWIIYNQRVFV